MTQSNPISILIADDDPDDRMMMAEAFAENRIANQIDFVEDGEELLDFLNCQGKYQDRIRDRLPGLILLDLNMPKKDGREALRELKADPNLCRIPIVVLTTSRAEEDIIKTYGLGVSSFVTKPLTFEGLVDAVAVICQYWIQIVALPPECNPSAK